MMGMFVVHGAQGGGFSPISIYGTITNSVMRDNGLPVSEIASVLHRRPGTVKSDLHLARERLRNALGGRYEYTGITA